MSSDYAAVCLHHDPAILVSDPFAWNRPAEALAAVADRSGTLATHARCDLIITRTSGALIEVCCPPTTAMPGHHPGAHTEPKWVAADWLRLMLAAIDEIGPDMNPGLGAALGRFGNFCWNTNRVRRLAPILGDDITKGAHA